MEHYQLREDEVVLYKGTVNLKSKIVGGLSQLVLTNHNLVFITKQENIDGENISVTTYPINEIKVFRDVYQIKKKGNIVEMYFLHDEVEFEFFAKGDTNKFVHETINLLTEKSSFERGCQNTKKAINTIDNTFGIDSVGIVSNILTNKLGGKFLGLGKNKK